MTLSESIVTKARTVCPECEAGDIIKYGKRNGVQVYRCKPCGKKFTGNGALPGRRVPPRIVGDAIGAFFDGLSYRDIQRSIESRHGFKPSSASIYEWVRDYSKKARAFLGNFKARTGDTWVADEMVIKVDGQKMWLWNVMDERSRFLLATHLSPTRTIADAETLFRKAKRHASRPPHRVITDGLAAYRDGIESVFGAQTRHVVSKGIRSREINNNLVERLNGTVRERTKVMRGMESKRTAERLLDGFRIHYNHMKPHHGIGGRTPAQAAGLPFVFEDWFQVAHLREVPVRDRSLEPQTSFKQPRLRSSLFRSSRRRL